MECLGDAKSGRTVTHLSQAFAQPLNKIKVCTLPCTNHSLGMMVKAFDSSGRLMVGSDNNIVGGE